VELADALHRRGDVATVAWRWTISRAATRHQSCEAAIAARVRETNPFIRRSDRCASQCRFHRAGSDRRKKVAAHDGGIRGSPK
jgi:hypothetical protein